MTDRDKRLEWIESLTNYAHLPDVQWLIDELHAAWAREKILSQALRDAEHHRMNHDVQ